MITGAQNGAAMVSGAHTTISGFLSGPHTKASGVTGDKSVGLEVRLIKRHVN